MQIWSIPFAELFVLLHDFVDVKGIWGAADFREDSLNLEIVEASIFLSPKISKDDPSPCSYSSIPKTCWRFSKWATFKTLLTFDYLNYTGWLTGILVMASHNLCNWVVCHPLYIYVQQIARVNWSPLKYHISWEWCPWSCTLDLAPPPHGCNRGEGLVPRAPLNESFLLDECYWGGRIHPRACSQNLLTSKQKSSCFFGNEKRTWT